MSFAYRTDASNVPSAFNPAVAACGSGSGYGTSSGSMLTTTVRSQRTSPPFRRFRTSESPSRRWLLTDRKRPVEKNTSSARALRAQRRLATKNAAPTVLLRLNERMKHANAQLSRVLAVRCRNESRHKRLIDCNREEVHVGRSELGAGQRNLPHHLLPRRHREGIEHLPAKADRDLLRLVEHAARIVGVEVKRLILFRVLERERRFLLGPLPTDRPVVLRDFRRVPAVLEDREHVFGLRQELQRRDLVGVLTHVLPLEREPALVRDRIQTDLNRRIADVR